MIAASNPWLATLEEGARLLQAGKPVEAAQMLESLRALCDQSAPPPSPETVARARALLQNCFQAEASLRQRVIGDMNRLASSRRAQVYRHLAKGQR
jgi:hypothetical protein